MGAQGRSHFLGGAFLVVVGVHHVLDHQIGIMGGQHLGKPSDPLVVPHDPKGAGYDKHPPRSAGYQPHHLRGRLSAPAVITADIGEAAASLNVRVERHHRMPGVYVCVQPFGHLGAVERGDEQPCGAGSLRFLDGGELILHAVAPGFPEIHVDGKSEKAPSASVRPRLTSS